MNALIFVTIVLLLIVIILASKLQNQSRSKEAAHTESDGNEQPEKPKYTRIGPMFSPAERSFLGVLDQAVADDFGVLSHFPFLNEQITIELIRLVLSRVRGSLYLRERG